MKELIGIARAQPGKLTYGSGGSGSSNHLAAELFKAIARVHLPHVPYKGEQFSTTEMTPGTPEAFEAHIAREIPKWRKVVSAARIPME